MAKVLSSVSTIMEVRSRLSLKSGDVHTSQPQVITGTPCDVPVPKNVIFKIWSLISCPKIAKYYLRSTNSTPGYFFTSKVKVASGTLALDTKLFIM